ncbi:hypothetical protein M3212_14925 [Alkalihalobacillus oceani]|uniref:hypothetical protein n=1 Tax=Halalkalibacter oceani TaxID=1653776 RepID=UPI0020421024|nr:hypothetical protein [Halalkalibacter oceani]MCM3762066.1 hypothetical protein [Halalkalibacter oceani]
MTFKKALFSFLIIVSITCLSTLATYASSTLLEETEVPSTHLYIEEKEVPGIPAHPQSELPQIEKVQNSNITDETEGE